LKKNKKNLKILLLSSLLFLIRRENEKDKFI